ncbi:MAG: hypothetical protein WC807_17805 [Hyphomicrobium sp.]|jgi:cbb3-type cytochrome oxidase subunit 3
MIGATVILEKLSIHWPSALWLMAGIGLYTLLVWLAWRPSARAGHEQHGRIPFAVEDDTDVG